ncbi:hypothetical protein [Paraburkholderia strydomiana]|uniref:hypothetical protein n=1 Tax=Paraburkholderia strydomiana TaxID=1245417 RepID=UPI001BE812BE|nr:hypothetical protein [Paraburkholderia strydomiana]MBT2794781.1 hypothetical protein [Paraburkholderia strydomiana]
MDLDGRYNEVGLYRNEAGQLELYIYQVMLNKAAAPPGLGTLTLWRMVRAAQQLDAAYIVLAAAGGRQTPPLDSGQGWDGYRFWPGLGFDGELTDEDRDFFRHFWFTPAGLDKAVTVRAVLALQTGRRSGNTAADLCQNAISKQAPVARPWRPCVAA